MEYGAYLQAIMSLVGYAANQQQQAKAQAMLQAAMDAYKNQDLPALQHIAAQVLPPSAMQAIQADPHAVTAQYAALSGLQDIISGNGTSAIDRANINRIGDEVDLAGRGARAAITNQSEANGSFGGGQQLAAMQAEGQAGNQRLEQAGLDEKSMALKNRLAAIGQEGSLAGQIRGQAFGEAADRAKAADSINQWNAAARMQADAANNQLAEEQFGNSMAKLAGSTGLATPIAGMISAKGAGMQQLGAGLGAAANDASAGGNNTTTPSPQTQGTGDASALAQALTSPSTAGGSTDTSSGQSGYTPEEEQALMRALTRNRDGGSYDAYDTGSGY